MAPPAFDRPSTSGKSEARILRDKQDQEVIQLLQSICGHPASAEKATENLDLSEAMESQVEISKDEKINRLRVQLVAEFLEAEKALSRAMLAFAGEWRTSRHESEDEEMYLMLKKKAIREFLAEYEDCGHTLERILLTLHARNTRESSQALNLTAMIDNKLSAWSVTVLEAMFEKQPNPNAAEIEFFAGMTSSDTVTIDSWCKWAVSWSTSVSNFKLQSLLSAVVSSTCSRLRKFLVGWMTRAQRSFWRC